MTETAAEPRKHRILLIVATVLYIVALPFVGMAAMMSPMASDAGANASVWTFIIAMMTWPVAIVVGVALGWVFFAMRLPRAMIAAIAAPLLWVLPLFTLGFGH